MISDILTPSKYGGKSVLISWEHKAISDLLKEIGVAQESIIDHPKKSFDITYVVSISQDQSNKRKASFRRLPQKLLFGDSTIL